MAVASGPAGPVLAGRVFTVVSENTHAQSAANDPSRARECTYFRTSAAVTRALPRHGHSKLDVKCFLWPVYYINYADP